MPFIGLHLQATADKLAAGHCESLGTCRSEAGCTPSCDIPPVIPDAEAEEKLAPCKARVEPGKGWTLLEQTAACHDGRPQRAGAAQCGASGVTPAHMVCCLF